MGKAKLLKQSIAQLSRAIDIKRITHRLIDFPLNAVNLGLKRLPKRLDALCIHQKTNRFHMGQNPSQRQLNGLQQLCLMIPGNLFC